MYLLDYEYFWHSYGWATAPMHDRRDTTGGRATSPKHAKWDIVGGRDIAPMCYRWDKLTGQYGWW